MIASLYQSGSSSAADGAVTTASCGRLGFDVSVRPAILEGEDVPLTHIRIEADVIPVAAPRVLHVVQQIAYDVGLCRGRTADLYPPVLHVTRIEVDDHENHRAA